MSTSRPTANSASVTVLPHDEDFYLSFIIFQVEETLFKVPRKAFQTQSDVFGAMFTLPPGEHNEQDGASDGRPIRLDHIQKEAFKAFLKILYPPPYGDSIRLSESDWVHVLSLAHMWSFERIRRLSIGELHKLPLDTIRKVELAHKYDISEWYHPTYLALALRENSLSVEEAARLGFDFAVKMAQVREKVLKDKLMHPWAAAGAWGSPTSRNARNLRLSNHGGRQVLSNIHNDDLIRASDAISEVFGIKRSADSSDMSSTSSVSVSLPADDTNDPVLWAVPQASQDADDAFF